MIVRHVLGHFSRTPVAVVREDGDRIECRGLTPWFVPQLLERIGAYWANEIENVRRPLQSVVLEHLSNV